MLQLRINRYVLYRAVGGCRATSTQFLELQEGLGVQLLLKQTVDLCVKLETLESDASPH